MSGSIISIANSNAASGCIKLYQKHTHHASVPLCERTTLRQISTYRVVPPIVQHTYKLIPQQWHAPLVHRPLPTSPLPFRQQHNHKSTSRCSPPDSHKTHHIETMGLLRSVNTVVLRRPTWKSYQYWYCTTTPDDHMNRTMPYVHYGHLHALATKHQCVFTPTAPHRTVPYRTIILIWPPLP